MTTSTRAAAPKKGPPAKATNTAERALTRAFETSRVTLLTRDVFLKSQGPPAMPVHLPGIGVVVLMRRVDLLDLARRGAHYYPFRSAIYGMISEGGLKKDQLEGEALADTLDLAAKIALDTIVTPPPDTLELLAEALASDEEEHGEALAAWQAEVDAAKEAKDFVKVAALGLSRPAVPMTRQLEVLLRLRAGDLRPLFVAEGDEPEADQLVLSYPLPDDDGHLPPAGDTDGGIPPSDLIVILRSAHRYGPGAMGRTFRGE